MGHPDRARRPVGLDGDDCKRVQSMECEGRELLGAESLVFQPCREEAQRTEAQPTRRGTRLAGNLDPPGVADADPFDPPGPVDEQSDPPVQRPRDRGHLAGKLVAQNRAGRNPAAVEPFQPVSLGRRKSQKIPVNGWNRRCLLDP